MRGVRTTPRCAVLVTMSRAREREGGREGGGEWVERFLSSNKRNCNGGGRKGGGREEKGRSEREDSYSIKFLISGSRARVTVLLSRDWQREETASQPHETST